MIMFDVYIFENIHIHSFDINRPYRTPGLTHKIFEHNKLITYLSRNGHEILNKGKCIIMSRRGLSYVIKLCSPKTLGNVLIELDAMEETREDRLQNMLEGPGYMFKIPDDEEGKQFVKLLRKYATNDYRFRVFKRGHRLSVDSGWVVRAENVTHRVVYATHPIIEGTDKIITPRNIRNSRFISGGDT